MHRRGGRAKDFELGGLRRAGVASPYNQAATPQNWQPTQSYEQEITEVYDGELELLDDAEADHPRTSQNRAVTQRASSGIGLRPRQPSTTAAHSGMRERAQPAGSTQPRQLPALQTTASHTRTQHTRATSQRAPGAAVTRPAPPKLVVPRLDLDDAEPLSFPKQRGAFTLARLATAAALLATGFVARGLMAPAPARSTTPAATALPPTAAASSAAPVPAALPEPPRAAAAPESRVQAEPAAPLTPRELARARRSAARAAALAERWRARHPHGGEATDADSVDDNAARAQLDTSGPAPREETSVVHTEAPATEPASANEATGVLRLNSRPWSQIYIDGEDVGHTPQRQLELPAGQHIVRLVNEPMGLSTSFSVTIDAGETLTKTVTLAE